MRLFGKVYINARIYLAAAVVAVILVAYIDSTVMLKKEIYWECIEEIPRPFPSTSGRGRKRNSSAIFLVKRLITTMVVSLLPAAGAH